MASAAKSFSRAFARQSTASLRTTARFATPSHAYRAGARRGYSSQSGSSSSSGLIWGLGAVVIGGGAGAYYYLNGGDVSAVTKKTSEDFSGSQADYQKVYDEIAKLLVEKDEYDDGSYGPVCVFWEERCGDVVC